MIYQRTIQRCNLLQITIPLTTLNYKNNNHNKNSFSPVKTKIPLKFRNPSSLSLFFLFFRKIDIRDTYLTNKKGNVRGFFPPPTSLYCSFYLLIHNSVLLACEYVWLAILLVWSYTVAISGHWTMRHFHSLCRLRVSACLTKYDSYDCQPLDYNFIPSVSLLNCLLLIEEFWNAAIGTTRLFFVETLCANLYQNFNFNFNLKDIKLDPNFMFQS